MLCFRNCILLAVPEPLSNSILMASYAMSNHSLHFENGYESLVVRDNDNQVVATYDLTAADQSISVAVTGTSYMVATASDFDTPTHVIDVDGGEDMTFNGTRMGGIIIVDIRDINRSYFEPGTYEISYNLACTTFRIKYVAGAFGLKIYFSPTSCFDIKEA